MTFSFAMSGPLGLDASLSSTPGGSVVVVPVLTEVLPGRPAAAAFALLGFLGAAARLLLLLLVVPVGTATTAGGWPSATPFGRTPRGIHTWRRHGREPAAATTGITSTPAGVATAATAATAAVRRPRSIARSARRARCAARMRDVQHQAPTTQIEIAQCSDGFIGSFCGAHRDEAE